MLCGVCRLSSEGLNQKQWMTEALDLARRSEGRVEPNPMVGALIIRDGDVVGRGAHEVYGGDHAEIIALGAAGEKSRGSTLVVTLEPCSTTGKTPPCTEALLKAGVARVVYGTVDPDSRHQGEGLSILEKGGVEIVGPVLEAECLGLLDRFRRHLSSSGPFVIAKWAMTLDGKVATRDGDSQWISGTASRRLVHEVRGSVDAIIVGRGTVEKDAPSLTARPEGPLAARRVVLDRQLSLPDDWKALRDGGPPILVFHSASASSERKAQLESLGVDLCALDDTTDQDFLTSALVAMRERGIQRVLVEGGPRLLGTFMDARQLHQIMVFVGPAVFGGLSAPGAIAGEGCLSVAEGLPLEAGHWTVLDGDAVYEAFVAQDSTES